MFMAIPPKKLYIMQGIPGSGKSTLARILRDYHVSSLTAPSGVEYTAAILSTDEFWGKDYRFDPAKLAEAHRWNQARTIRAMEEGINYIYIDNTNILKSQAAPYFMMGDIFGYEASVVHVDVSLEVAVKRNASREYHRRVPEAKVKEMYEKLERLV